MVFDERGLAVQRRLDNLVRWGGIYQNIPGTPMTCHPERDTCLKAIKWGSGPGSFPSITTAADGLNSEAPFPLQSDSVAFSGVEGLFGHFLIQQANSGTITVGPGPGCHSYSGNPNKCKIQNPQGHNSKHGCNGSG